MDDHTAYVELLAELTAMGKAPTDDVGWVLDVDEGIGHFWRPPHDDPRTYRDSLTIDAHNAIRLAAEDMLREWCKIRLLGESLLIDEDKYSTGFYSVDWYNCDGASRELIGTGPTIAVALLDAVRAVRGTKEKA